MKETHTHHVIEDGVERAVNELHLNLPLANVPLPIRLIILFTLIGGLSMIGSTFADIYDPAQPFGSYIFRLLAGVLFVFVSYGLVELKTWGIWLYGFLVSVAFFVNIKLVLFPLIVVLYLYSERRFFKRSLIDDIVESVWQRIRLFLNR